MTGTTDAWTLFVIVGLGGVTLLTRCFFFILDRPWTLPAWAQRALHYAPIAAMAGVIAPEVVMSHGQLVATWQDARLFGAAAGMLAYFASRSVLMTLVAGMVVYLPLHLILGW